jgi:parallel beta-helix repeat protein
MFPIRNLFAALAAAVLFVPSAVHAQEERCVDTVAEFNSAWVLADDDSVIIRMAAGTYDFAAFTGETVDDDVEILGGYNATCTSRSQDPDATVITHGSGGGLSFSTVKNTMEGAGSLRFERLTFRGLSSVSVAVEGFNTPDYFLVLERVWLDAVGQFRLTAGAELFARSILVTKGGSCALRLGSKTYSGGTPDTTYLERVVIENSTFADNAGPGLCIGRTDFVEDDWRLDLTNSVFWNNGGIDISLNNPGVATINAVLRNNTYTAIDSNRALTTAPSQTSSGNPLFVNAASDDYHLLGASPGINSGRTNIKMQAQADIEGNPRWFGEAPDRGAFESNIGSTATVLNVTSSADSGAGTLRQALIDANAAANANTINFNIGGACPRTITLASLLPDIVHAVAIKGYSQPGATPNTLEAGWNAAPCIILNGANQITGAYGFNVDTGASPDATVSIEGIAFSGHSIAAMQFVAGRNHRFVGNQIGGAVGAVNLIASGTGVRIGGTVEDVQVGGPAPADRNVVAGTLGVGINISGSGANQPRAAVVENNNLGTQTDSSVLPNERGIFIAGPDHVIRNNVIANATSHGIDISGALATGNRIYDNWIGTTFCLGSTCADRGNSGHGVMLRNDAADNRVTSNIIVFNGLDGITVTDSRRNSIRFNTMYDNQGIGIDLGDNGRKIANSNNSVPAPSDAGNDDQNYPVISTAVGTPANAFVSGSLTSANGWYRLDFYGVPDGCPSLSPGGIPIGSFDEGRDWIGSKFLQITNGTADTDGTANYADVKLERENRSNYFINEEVAITSTATRLSGAPGFLSSYQHHGTSEFGRCREFVTGATPELLFKDGFELPEFQ